MQLNLSSQNHHNASTSEDGWNASTPQRAWGQVVLVGRLREVWGGERGYSRLLSILSGGEM